MYNKETINEGEKMCDKEEDSRKIKRSCATHEFILL
jgi:hypothetical protein